jgi:hypothetical protein
MKISVDAEELADYDVLERAAEKYHTDYGISKQELIDRMKAEPQLSLYISEDDAIRWGIVNRPTELF